MIGDILAVAIKEWKELLWVGGMLRGGRIGIVVMLLVFGVFLPYQTGIAWITSPATMFYWTWVPLMVVSGAVADSFAGERERHTLETLLASRLSDRAILFGKVVATAFYGWGLMMLMLLVSLITVNVSSRAHGLVMFPLRFAVAAPTLAWLGSGLAGTAGVLVSLRAATVRQAAQTLNMGILALVFLPVLAMQALSTATKSTLVAWVTSVGVDGLLVMVAAALFLIDAALLTACMARFRRARLILD